MIKVCGVHEIPHRSDSHKDCRGGGGGIPYLFSLQVKEISMSLRDLRMIRYLLYLLLQCSCQWKNCCVYIAMGKTLKVSDFNII